MKNWHSNALIAAGQVTTCLVGLLLGAAIASPELGFVQWLNKWSTLIAGLLAVMAAGLTITAMIWVDERQRKRHDELVLLQVRPDALKAWKAAEPMATALEEWAKEVESRRDNVLAAGGQVIDPNSTEAGGLLASKVGQLDSIWNSGKHALNQADHLLTPAEVAACKQVEAFTVPLASDASTVKNCLDQIAETQADPFHQGVNESRQQTANAALSRIVAKLPAVLASARALSDCLKALRVRYSTAEQIDVRR